jgi:uncharacterized membrane protein (UPF0136 family)
VKILLNRFDTLITAFSVLLLVGGIIGFIVAGSQASLFMSSMFAVLLISSLFYMRLNPVYGYRTVFSLLTVLALFFAYRGFSVKFMPSGMLCILTLVVLTYAIILRNRANDTGINTGFQP